MVLTKIYACVYIVGVHVLITTSAASLDCRQTKCQNGACVKKGNHHECFCWAGFALSPSSRTRCLPVEGFDMQSCRYAGCMDGACSRQKDGSFKCVCFVGYKPSPTDKNACIPEDCRDRGRGCTNGVCLALVDGTAACKCNPGFRPARYDFTLCEPAPHLPPIYQPPPPPVPHIPQAPKPSQAPPKCGRYGCENGDCVSGPGGKGICKCRTGYRNDIFNPEKCIVAGFFFGSDWFRMALISDWM